MGTGAITAMALGCALVGAAAVGWWVRRRPGQVGVGAIVVGVGAVGVASFVGAVAIVASQQRSGFSVVHLGYLVAVVSVPLVGIVVAALTAARRGRWSTVGLAVLLVAPVPVGWYATHVAPFRLRVDRAEFELPAARSGSDPVRVGVIADIQATHVTGYERRAVATLVAQRPDVIVVAGDVFQGSAAQFDANLADFRTLLGGLRAPHGVYAVRGDVDTGHRLDRLVKGTGIEILDNEIVTLAIGDRTVRLGGNPLRWAPDPALNVRRELSASDPGDIRILVAHRPEVIFGVIPDLDIDLTVAGHTHGGQVAIPGFGPPVTFTSVPRKVAAGGLHEVQGKRIYVSSGVGMVRLQAPQIRLFTRPSVGVVTLR